jgi:hypothetical protein
MMLNRRRVSKVAAFSAMLAAALTGTVLAVAAQSGAVAAGAPTAHVSTAAHASARITTLHVHITACDTCSIQLVHAIQGSRSVWESRQQRVGSDRVATFKFPTRYSHGMSFDIQAPWAKGINYVPNAVTAYAGQKVGSKITLDTAEHSRHAAGCWAGTSRRTKTLFFHTLGQRFGHHALAPLVFARHTLPSWQPAVKTDRGVIGNQDAFYCVPPKS